MCILQFACVCGVCRGALGVCVCVCAGADLGFDEVGGVAVYVAREPAFKAFSKVSNGLCECARNGPEDVRDEEVHNALVEDVVTRVEVVYDWLATCQQNDLLFW